MLALILLLLLILFFFGFGFSLHLLWIAAVVLLVLWAILFLTRRTARGRYW